MIARAVSSTPWGVDARRVAIEVDVCNGPPQIHIVGLQEASIRESRKRVRSAIRDSGFDLPPRVMVVTLAPAERLCQSGWDLKALSQRHGAPETGAATSAG